MLLFIGKYVLNWKTVKKMFKFCGLVSCERIDLSNAPIQVW